MPVTLSSKRYIFICAGCGLLADTCRRDSITCSPACRVKAHRSGNAARLRELAAAFHIRPSIIQQCGALNELRPDLSEQVKAGKLTIDDAQAYVETAFDQRVMRQITEEATP